MKFFIKDFVRKCDQIRRELQIWSHLLTADLVTFTEKILYEKLHFLCSEDSATTPT